MKILSGQYHAETFRYEETTQSFHYFIKGTLLGDIIWIEELQEYAFVPCTTWSYTVRFATNLENVLNRLTREATLGFHGYQERLPDEKTDP